MQIYAKHDRTIPDFQNAIECVSQRRNSRQIYILATLLSFIIMVHRVVSIRLRITRPEHVKGKRTMLSDDFAGSW